MPAEVIMPALGMAQQTGKLLRWHKREGDEVVKGEPLFEVETDKVTVDIEAPAGGTLAAVRASEGDEVAVGERIAFVLAAGELLPEGDGAASAAEPAAELAPVASASRVLEAPPPPTDGRPRRKMASPKARKLAQVHGIEIDLLAGSGPNGAVVAADVEAAFDALTATGVAAPAVAAPAARNGEGELETGTIWRVMAERTTHSWQSVPHFYLRRTVDASRLGSWRDVVRAKPGGSTVSFTDLLVRIVVEALRRHPRVNASWQDGALVAGDRINVGIAVAVDAGLVVPVVHDADRLDMPALAARRAELVDAARGGRLRPEDVTGGTFTISNLGMYGVDSFDAIVNAPQAAILAVGRIRDAVLPVDGAAAVRPVLELSVSFDHRVVDGARGAEFLDTLASLVEEPAGLVS